MQELLKFISSHPVLSVATLVVFVLATTVELIRAKRNVFAIPASRVVKLINQDNAAVLDIRSNDLFKKGHIIDAISISAKEISDNQRKLEKFRARPLVLVCNTGMDSQKLAAQLLKQGYNCYSLSGGMRAWIDEQMPVVKD